MSARLTLLLALCAAAVCESPAADRSNRGNWRLTVGPSIIGGVRARIGGNAQQMVRLSGFGMTISELIGSGWSKEEAYANGSGEAHGGKRVFDGGAWYDPNDSAAENDGEWSWNWRLHNPSAADRLNPDGKRGYVEYTSYVEESEKIETVLKEIAQSGDGSEWFPGLRVEAARELYCSDDERPWGVDLALAFAYYFERDLWKASGTAATASAQGSREQGRYKWWNDSHDEAQYILDYYRDSQFHGGMWGSGSYYGPGAELATDGWRGTDEPLDVKTTSWNKKYTLSYDGKGSYREYSFELIARPWWEPWDWLRLFLSLGIEVSRREFEWSMSVRGTDGTSYGESGEASDWRMLGLFGGGFFFQWHQFILAGEALWRFGGSDLDVDGLTVDGHIEHGDWGFRASVGYEF